MTTRQHTFSTRNELIQHLKNETNELHRKIRGNSLTLKDVERLVEVHLTTLKLLESDSKTTNKNDIISSLRSLITYASILAKEFERAKIPMVQLMRKELIFSRDFLQEHYGKNVHLPYPENQIPRALQEISDKLNKLNESFIVENSVTPALEQWQQCYYECVSILEHIDNQHLSNTDRIEKKEHIENLDLLFHYHLEKLNTWHYYIRVICYLEDLVSNHELLRKSPTVH